MTPRLVHVRIRWWIFAFMLAFVTLSYIQRLGVQDLAVTIMPALRLSQLQIGWLATAFTAAYTVAQIPGGIFSQQVGARRALVTVGVFGLLATLVFPLAPQFWTGTALFSALLFAQILLGLSQGPLIPAQAAVFEAWLPVNRWAMANGLQTAGMNFGGILTPLILPVLSGALGWQGALISIAVPVGLLTGAWAWYGRDRPREHPSVTRAELAELGSGASEVSAPITGRRLLKLLRDRNVVLTTLSYVCVNYTYYLLSFWSFLYLIQVRHFSGIEAGLAGALPWLGAAVGSTVGGFTTDSLATRLGIRWGYRLLPMLTLPVAAAMLLVTLWVSTPYAAVAALTVAFFMVELNEGAYGAAIMYAARSDIAAAYAILNTGGNIGGIIAQPLVGYLTNEGAWRAAFITGAVFSVLAAAIWLGIDPERQTER